MPHALALSMATLAVETEGYLGTWVLECLGTSSSTDVFTWAACTVVRDKPCLGLACPYRAAGRYATALVSQHHQHNHTTTTQPNSPQTPIPFPLTPSSSISPTFMTLDASAASATIPGPMRPSPMVFSPGFITAVFAVPCRNGCCARFLNTTSRSTHSASTSLPPLRSAAGSQLPRLPCHSPPRIDEFLTASTIWLLTVLIKYMAGRIFRVARLPYKEMAGAFNEIHGSHPTHLPARPTPIPDQRPVRLAPGALCARHSPPLYRLLC